MKRDWWIVLTIIACTLLLIEATSYFILEFNNTLKINEPFFNRQISGICVYKNSPGYKYNTIKCAGSEQDVEIDKYGFVSLAEPQLEKSKNLIRVFITGGSAAFGSGQAQPYDQIKKYPTGIYSYESSIAGNILNNLEKKFPEKNFEIINACSSGRKLNQSIALYLEIIKDFDPDIIVSIDGNNDLETIGGVSPYKIDEEIILKKYIELSEISESLKKKTISNTINLIEYLNFYFLKQKMAEVNTENSEQLLNYDSSDYSQEMYELKKSTLIQTSETFTDLILYYEAVCDVEDTELIFCLQPMLYREENKIFTQTEIKMRNNVNPINISLSNPSMEEAKLHEYEENGNIILKSLLSDKNNK